MTHGATTIDELIAADAFLSSLGLRRADGATDVLVLPPLERHLAVPDAGIVHGGVVAAFLEATAMLHLCALDAATTVRRTVEFTSDFLRPVPLAPTFAQAVVLRRSRRFASVRVEAWQDERHQLFAAGMGRFVLGRSPAGSVS